MKTKKRLYRSDDHMIAGVLAGIAEYFDHDPTIWRLAFVFFLILTGFFPGVVMYLVAWIVIPHKSQLPPEVEYTVHEAEEKQ